MSKKIVQSNSKGGKEVRLTKSLIGFPKGSLFIVINSSKKAGTVGGHHYKYTITVVSKDEQENIKPTFYVMPVKYLK